MAKQTYPFKIMLAWNLDVNMKNWHLVCPSFGHIGRGTLHSVLENFLLRTVDIIRLDFCFSPRGKVTEIVLVENNVRILDAKFGGQNLRIYLGVVNADNSIGMTDLVILKALPIDPVKPICRMRPIATAICKRIWLEKADR